MFGRMKMLFCFCAMPVHVIVIGSACPIHLVDGLGHVIVDRIQIVPVMHPLGNRQSGGKRQAYRKSTNDKRFLHRFSSPELCTYTSSNVGE